MFSTSLCHITSSFFFFNAPATTEIYTLSLHDALPIYSLPLDVPQHILYLNSKVMKDAGLAGKVPGNRNEDRKSTRLNSSHRCISYAVFCLKKKKKKKKRLKKTQKINIVNNLIKNK